MCFRDRPERCISFYVSEIDLKDASKFFATKFSCGSSVSGDDEIVIQGDVKDDLFDILPEKWSQVSHDRNILPFLFVLLGRQQNYLFDKLM